MKRVNQVIGLSFLILMGCGKTNHTISTDSTDVMSQINLSDLEGNPVKLSLHKGKVVLINFWATWCKPCIQEMPTLANAQEKFKDENIVFLFASNEEVDQIMKFKNKHSYNFQYVRIENMEEIGIQALPTTYIFDEEGKLVFSEAGFRTWDAAENIELISNIIKHE